MKKNYKVSYTSKQAICASLKRQMAQKPLDKITIAEIMNGCGMRRQHFYYHFTDIYDAVRWMFEEEAVSLLRQQEGALLWQEGLLQLFRYLTENRTVCLCALNSLSREHIRQFFETNITAIVRRTIDHIAQHVGLSEWQTEFETELMTRFYVVSLSGMVECWLLGEISCMPEELIQFADTMLKDQIRGLILRFTGNAGQLEIGV